MSKQKTKVAIIGTGNIGSDLCARLIQSKEFEVVAFVGRRPDSPGLVKFRDSVTYSISNGIAGLIEIIDEFEGFFDATSAFEHLKHWEILKQHKKWAIDLTPSKIGTPMVPELIGHSDKFLINGKECLKIGQPCAEEFDLLKQKSGLGNPPPGHSAPCVVAESGAQGGVLGLLQLGIFFHNARSGSTSPFHQGTVVH